MKRIKQIKGIEYRIMSADSTTSPKKYLDFLRILACFFVVFNHTGRNGFFLFSQYPTGSGHWWLYCFISIFCKFAVPCFFMISGMLLISKEESLFHLWRKRIIHIGIILVLFSFAYYYYFEIYTSQNPFCLPLFIKQLYSSDWNHTFWYLYAYISFLICLPFLRAMCQHLKSQYFEYLFFLQLLLTSILPILEYLVWEGKYCINSDFYIPIATVSTLFFPCIGYYLDTRIDVAKISAKKWILLWSLCIILLCVSCFMTYYKAILTDTCSEGDSQTFHSSFISILAMMLFLSVKAIYVKHQISDKLSSIISAFSRNTFGIYLVHYWVLTLLNKTPVLGLINNIISDKMISITLYCICILLISNFLTVLLRCIPIIKRII